MSGFVRVGQGGGEIGDRIWRLRLRARGPPPTPPLLRYHAAFWQKGPVHLRKEWDKLLKKIAWGEKKLGEKNRLTEAAKTMFEVGTWPGGGLAGRRLERGGSGFTPANHGQTASATRPFCLARSPPRVDSSRLTARHVTTHPLPSAMRTHGGTLH